MHELTRLIREDMKPALGVTEPGAIAYCAATARAQVPGELVRLSVSMNSGLYKNAMTCGIPNSTQVGAAYAAALGFAAGDPEKGLEALADADEAAEEAAGRYVREGRVEIRLSGFSSRIYLQARLETTGGEAEVTIRDYHTNITRIRVNGKTVLEKPEENGREGKPDPAEADRDGEDMPRIHRYTLRELLEYAESVPVEEIRFVLEAYRTNLALFREGMDSPRTGFARRLLALNGGKEISGDERRTASLLCNAAIEARVTGLNRPAMSITGSGAHGIIATLPLYALQQIHGLSEEALCRATMLSFLVCTYIKEYSGRLSAFCGCGIAAGTGMAMAACRMKGGDYEAVCRTLNNMASSITGMICDGGNQGCVMKGVAACAAAFDSADLALGGVSVSPVHGINGRTPEETMRNMGRIASPGMTETEKTIVAIQEEKGGRNPAEGA